MFQNLKQANKILLISISIPILIVLLEDTALIKATFAVEQSSETDKITSALARLGKWKYSSDPNRLNQYTQIRNDISAENLPILEKNIWFYQAECMYLSGDLLQVKQIINQQSEKGVNNPELLLLKLWLAGGGNEKVAERITILKELGRILPLSIHGRDRDNRLSPYPVGKINPPLPFIPYTARLEPALREIGAVYEKAGLIEEALNVYLESCYCSFAPSDEKGRSEIWLKIAKIEKKRRHKNLAVQAYLKAAYTCPWRDYHKTAAMGINDIVNIDVLEPEPEQQLVLDGANALRIAKLYQKVNLHPLALSVLIKAETENNIDLRNEKEVIEEEWQKLIDRHIQVRGLNCFILGQNVSEVDDWAKITILRPRDTFWKPKLDLNKSIK